MLPYSLVRPFLHLFDAETAHRFAIRALKIGLVSQNSSPDDIVLEQSVWNINFPNPIGLAAGFDKDAEVPDTMLNIGFRFVELGTVTPAPQLGNQKPRLFRLREDEAAINRLGFNSGGLNLYAERLSKRIGKPGIIGANIGKNQTTVKPNNDYVIGIKRVTPLANYIVINISSPNTEGLRTLQTQKNLDDLVKASIKALRKSATGLKRMPPLLVKVAPDLNDEEIADIAEVVLATGIDGLIIGNTTLDRPETLRSKHRTEAGGLSGRPLMEKSTQCLSTFYQLTNGKIPLIGCGGVYSGQDAYKKIRAGATLIQIYTALVFHGPELVSQIKNELTYLLKNDGFRNIKEAIAADHG